MSQSDDDPTLSHRPGDAAPAQSASASSQAVGLDAFRKALADLKLIDPAELADVEARRQPTDAAALASALVRKGVAVITPRGELHTGENIGERLAMRNFMQEIREAGVITPPHKPFSSRDKQRFSDTLDREPTRLFNAKSPRG